MKALGNETSVVCVDGLTIAFSVSGDEQCPPMVLLHGLGDDCQHWQTVLPALAARHRVYALDARGHGQSTRSGLYSFELMRDDVLRFLDATKIERCIAVGHSMGGIVALLTA